MDDLEKWLTEIGCAQHADSLRSNGVTVDLVAMLTEEDLKELGLNLGDRKRILRGLARLTSGAEQFPEAASAAQALFPHPEQRSAAGERRRLTVMFVDLVNSTAMLSRMDPEEWSEALQNCQDVIAGVVSRFSGHVAQYLGDGAVCLFGWPKALEDAAERSVEAGLAVVENMRRVSAAGERVQCRIGIATGLVVIGDHAARRISNEDVAIGETVNFAARLQSFAGPGQIVVSDSTRQLLGDAFLLKSLGERSFKGISGKKTVHAVTGRNPLHERFAARSGERQMVERDAELSLVTQRWAMARQGEGQVVALVGEAGIGKSRLSHALLAQVGTENAAQIPLQCSPFLQDAPLSPVINYLSGVADIRPEQDNEQRLAGLRSVLDGAGLSEDEIGAVVSLLDVRTGMTDRLAAMSPSGRRAATLSALAEFVVGMSRQRPLLVRIEDAHWIDPTTLDLVTQLIDRVGQERILVLITTRPDGRPNLPDRDFVSSITLNRLARNGVFEIVRGLGGGALPEATIEAIIERTDGVPLFVEELTKAILEGGDMSVPASLHDTLMARLDRIPGVKEIAQAASVFGREFLREALAKVTRAPGPRLTEALEDLRRVELVFARDTEATSYAFKHALVRDAAYESLLNRTREEIHGRIFEVLRDEPQTTTGVLAYHAAAARRIDDAVEYGRRAAEEALRRPAYAEAITLLERTLALIGGDCFDPRWSGARKELLILLRQAQIARFGYAAEPTIRTSTEMERIARETGDNELLIEGLYGRWAAHYVPGRTREALQVADQICAVSEAVEDTLEKALGWRLRASALIMMGRVDESAGSLAQFDRHYDPVAHVHMASRFGQEAGVARNCYEVGLLTLQGRFESAARLAHRIVDELGRLNHPHTTGYALGHVACFLTASEIEPLGSDIARECIETSRRGSMPLWLALGQASLAVSEAHQGNAAASVPALRQGLKGLSVVQFDVFRTLFLPSYALGLAESGDFAAAEAELGGAHALIAENGTSFFESEVIRTEGQLALMRRNQVAAESCFEHALKRARELGHPSWELRAALDLERLYRSTGRAAQGEHILGSVLAKFDEGHSLPLLRRAAKALERAA